MKKSSLKNWFGKNRDNLPFIGFKYDWLILSYVLLALLLTACFPFKIQFNFLFDLTYDLPFLLLIIAYLAVQFTWLAFLYRRKKKDRFLFGTRWRRFIIREYFCWTKLFDLIRVLLLLKLVLIIYFNIKQAIPIINPDYYDTLFLNIDKIIHLGLNPNSWLPSAFSNNYFSWGIDLSYISWFLVKPFVLAFFVTMRQRQLQKQFFGAYLAIWIIGGLTAVLLPSLGPIYTNPEWYSHLVKPFATTLQKVLFAHYQQVVNNPCSYKVFIYEGIAAFPSLHVGIAALFACFLFKVNKVTGIVMWSYAALIMFGSVYLGWHYAVDGYYGIILACVIYKISTQQFYSLKKKVA